MCSTDFLYLFSYVSYIILLGSLNQTRFCSPILSFPWYLERALCMMYSYLPSSYVLRSPCYGRGNEKWNRFSQLLAACLFAGNLLIMKLFRRFFPPPPISIRPKELTPPHRKRNKQTNCKSRICIIYTRSGFCRKKKESCLTEAILVFFVPEIPGRLLVTGI